LTYSPGSPVEAAFSPAQPVETAHQTPRASDYIPGRISAMVKAANLIAIIVPFLGLVTAIVLLWGWGFSWVHLGLMVGMYIVTAFGITIGYHRLFTHKAFETTPTMKFIFAAMGSMAVEGPVLKWVAMHRRHHQHSDDQDDPHSPHLHGHGFKGMLRGLWHAHAGWIFGKDPVNLTRYIPDLLPDRILRAASSTWFLWSLLGLIIPAGLGGLITMKWSGVLLGFIWGGLVRIFLVHHVTWSVNSICHLWGTQEYRSHDESRNNFLVGVLAMGEGWHNNHHAFPTSARLGLRWWQIDTSYYVIRMLELVGLAWKVKVPNAAARAAKAVKPA